MTDPYLRSLGFVPTNEERDTARPSFNQAWRYRHNQQAQDGALLFIEHPFGLSACRLSQLEAPLAAQDVVATVSLLDQPALETAIESFFTAHGGRSTVASRAVSQPFRPFRRPL
ncbi:hypothetical protein [Hymenobacter crusticola]|uniref:Uncharacterized protein n=1 Tax=Hymenobacter crusticola TaxID=1770526 RepID=A0A243W888_9BACT|nr:hypothetical protein [Hymenobacter crusticola]OUJ71391.1 hypothetical protein BXP70_21785 [Hymenobacter crusticola]